MFYVVTALYVLTCFLLLLVVLLQRGKGGDIANAFGGGGTQTAFGARAGARTRSGASAAGPLDTSTTRRALPARTVVLSLAAEAMATRKWRNWQTHQLEGLAGATPWRFESSLPHQPSSSIT
jgi:protein translocase SecG subunit